jgi:hypothetical protein
MAKMYCLSKSKANQRNRVVLVILLNSHPIGGE